MAVTAKSVVFDFTNGYGGGIGIRSVDFYNGASKISLSTSDFSAYYSSTGSSSLWHSRFVFDTSLSKIDGASYTSWRSSYSTNQRIIIVFNSEQIFSKIVINNWHESGSDTSRGVKDTKITTTLSTYSNTTGGAAVTNGSVLWEGIVNEHVGSNVEDPQEIDFSNNLIFSLPSISFVGALEFSAFILDTELPVISPTIEGTFHKPGLITTLPSLDVSIEGSFVPRVVELEFDLPSIGLEGGITSNKINLETTLPGISCVMHSGAQIEIELPGLAFSGEVEATKSGDISVNLPQINALFQTGAQIVTSFPGIKVDIQEVATTTGQIAINLPSLSCKMQSEGNLFSELITTLPSIIPQITGAPGNVGNISLEIPKLKVGIRSISEIDCNLSVFLPSLHCNTFGDSSVNSHLALVLPNLVCKISTKNEQTQILRHVRGAVR